MTQLRAWLTQRSFTDRVVVGLTLLLLVLVTVSSSTEDIEEASRSFDWWALLLLLGTSLALLVHTRWPGISALPVVGLSTIYYGMGYTNGLINVPIMVACYQFGTTGDRRPATGAASSASAPSSSAFRPSRSARRVQPSPKPSTRWAGPSWDPPRRDRAGPPRLAGAVRRTGQDRRG